MLRFPVVDFNLVLWVDVSLVITVEFINEHPQNPLHFFLYFAFWFHNTANWGAMLRDFDGWAYLGGGTLCSWGWLALEEVRLGGIDGLSCRYNAICLIYRSKVCHLMHSKLLCGAWLSCNLYSLIATHLSPRQFLIIELPIIANNVVFLIGRITSWIVLICPFTNHLLLLHQTFLFKFLKINCTSNRPIS